MGGGFSLLGQQWSRREQLEIALSFTHALVDATLRLNLRNTLESESV